MDRLSRRKHPASEERPDINSRRAENGMDLNTMINNTITDKIDPRLTNEALIIAKLRAQVCKLDDGDTDAIASAYASTAQGTVTRALKVASTAQGADTIAAGVASSTQGISNVATGTAATAQGYETMASGLASTAQGIATNALEVAAYTEGISTTATGEAAHAEGYFTAAEGRYSHAEGQGTRAIGEASHAEGADTRAEAAYTHAEGAVTQALGSASHAEGFTSIARGVDSHAEGFDTTAEGEISHAEGEGTIARGSASHAQGFETISNGNYSHAEGQNTIAQGFASHVEGNLSVANGNYSHAEGFTTNASGLASHAEGNVTIANGAYTHAEGFFTTTGVQEGAHIMGKYGDATFPYSWHLANGTDDDNRGLAAVIRNDGQGISDQGWVTGNADFAEMFETLSGKTIPPGYFVTLEGDKIRKAGSDDDFILGITSAAPAFLGDAEELRWKRKYAKDEWGRVKYSKVVIPEQRDKNGNITMPERTELRPALNPEYRSPEKYIPRSQRPEWVPVAALGKVFVRDDGTCCVNGYCTPNNDGIAAASKKGYRVLKRTGPKQVLIWLK